MSVRYYALREGERAPDEFCAIRFARGRKTERVRYVRSPPTCTMGPANRCDEECGIYKCSNCGELWQFDCGGPRESGWACCPRCASEITYEDET